jgi:hypothetical protein
MRPELTPRWVYYSVEHHTTRHTNKSVESKVGTAGIEMDEGKPAAVTARDSETDSEQRAEPNVMDKM